MAEKNGGIAFCAICDKIQNGADLRRIGKIRMRQQPQIRSAVQFGGKNPHQIRLLIRGDAEQGRESQTGLGRSDNIGVGRTLKYPPRRPGDAVEPAH
jgi:hypothetical protein